MRSSEKAWILLAAVVVVYEIFAGEGELLSHQVDRWLESHPVITHSIVMVTAAHLLNVLPERIDPWVWMFKWRNFVA